MKLGVFTVVFGDRPLEAALDRIVAAGLDCVEIGTGNYPGHAHCRPERLHVRDVGGIALGPCALLNHHRSGEHDSSNDFFHLRP